jgi:hypothetical protein
MTGINNQPVNNHSQSALMPYSLNFLPVLSFQGNSPQSALLTWIKLHRNKRPGSASHTRSSKRAIFRRSRRKKLLAALTLLKSLLLLALPYLMRWQQYMAHSSMCFSFVSSSIDFSVGNSETWEELTDFFCYALPGLFV